MDVVGLDAGPVISAGLGSGPDFLVFFCISSREFGRPHGYVRIQPCTPGAEVRGIIHKRGTVMGAPQTSNNSLTTQVSVTESLITLS